MTPAPTRRRPKPPEMPLLSPGTVIVDFVVPGRPVPWKASTVTRRGHAYKDKSLLAWQATVGLYARLAMGGKPPYAGPVEVELVFVLKPKAGSPPDTSNLVKAFEDSLQGIVIINDRQVVKVAAERWVRDVDKVYVAIKAVNPSES